MIADVNDIEARTTRRQLDHRLLALLLFRHLLGIDLDAGELFEFLLIFLKDFAARALDEIYFKRGASILLPVNGRLGARLRERWANARDTRGGDGRCSRQKLTTCWT